MATVARGYHFALKCGTALLVAHLALGVAPAIAQTWDGDVSTDWLDDNNWVGDIEPLAGDNATIDNGALANQPRIFAPFNVEVNSLTHTAGTLTIDAGASLTTPNGYVLGGTGQLLSAGAIVGTFTVQGAAAATMSGSLTGSLTINGGAVTNSGSVSGTTFIDGGTLNLNAGSNLADNQTLTVSGGTVNVNTSETVGTVAGPGGTINLAAGQTLTTGGANANSTFQGVFAGAGGLTKEGTGTFQITGANTYTGPTTINGGTLLVNANGSLAATAVANNATLIFSGNASAGTATITTATGGAINTQGTRFIGTSVGGTSAHVVNAGGLLDITEHANAGVGIGSLAGAGTVAIGGKTLTVGSDNTTTAFSGVIRNGGNEAGSAALAGNLIKTGTGILTLSGANTYTGTTTVASGQLNAANNDALGTTAGGTTVAGGATLALTGGISIGAEALTLNGIGLASGGALRNLSGDNFYGGPVTLGSSAVIGVTGGNLTVSGTVDNAGNTLTLAPFNGASLLTMSGVISGAGGVTVDGPGSVRFTADNTYTGTTTIASGTLIVGNGAASGTLGTGDVVNNGALTFIRANALTYAGAISGTGSLTKDGNGALTLTGAQTYTGATTITAGQLRIGGTGSLGATTVTNNSVLAFLDTGSAGTSSITNNANMTFSNNSTAGNSTINNQNIIFFNNTSTGGSSTFTNSAGDQIIWEDNSTAGNAVVTNGGQVVFREDASAGNATIITNVGSAINFQGTRFVGNATGGTSRHVVNAGGLLDITEHAGAGVTIGSLAGAGAVAVGGKTLGVGTSNTSTTFSGVIQNLGNQAGSGAAAGGLTKVGTGTLTLTGNSTYTGATTVNAGTLIVNGSLASAVTVGANGTFGGAGTIAGLTANGIVSPGNSPGTLTVNGNVAFGAGSTYVAEVEGAQADRINATGTATIDNGSTLRLVALGGTYLFNTPYTLLSAQGGRTGTFGTVQTQGSFGAGITTNVAYTGTDVNLTLAPAPLVPIVTNPTGNAPTPPNGPPATVIPQGRAAFGAIPPTNVTGVAAAFDAALASGANLQPYFALYNQSAANLPGALNTFSGEVHTASAAMGFDVSGRFLATMLDPFALGRRGMAGAGMPAFFAAEQLASQRYASDLGPLGRMGRTSLDVPMPDPRYSVWGSAFGATGHVDGNATTGAAKRESDHAGIAVGADYRFNPNATVGFAVSGAKANASLANGLGSSEADSFQAGLYGMARAGDVSFGVSAAYTWLDVEARRTVPVLGFQPLSGDYDAHGFSGRAQAAWAAFRTAGVTISPTAAIQALSIRTDGFTETAAGGGAVGAAALTVAGRTANEVRTELGLRLDATFRAGTTDVTAFASAAWAHYLERDIGMSASLAAIPVAAFTVQGAQRDRDAALVGLGLDIAFTRAVSLTARTDAAFSANASEIGGSATLRVRF